MAAGSNIQRERVILHRPPVRTSSLLRRLLAFSPNAFTNIAAALRFIPYDRAEYSLTHHLTHAAVINLPACAGGRKSPMPLGGLWRTSSKSQPSLYAIETRVILFFDPHKWRLLELNAAFRRTSPMTSSASSLHIGSINAFKWIFPFHSPIS